MDARFCSVLLTNEWIKIVYHRCLIVLGQYFTWIEMNERYVSITLQLFDHNSSTLTVKENQSQVKWWMLVYDKDESEAVKIHLNFWAFIERNFTNRKSFCFDQYSIMHSNEKVQINNIDWHSYSKSNRESSLSMRIISVSRLIINDRFSVKQTVRQRTRQCISKLSLWK